MIRFFVKGEPRALSVGETVRAGRRSFQKRRHSEWADHVGLMGKQHRPDKPMTGALEFIAHFMLPTPKRHGPEPITRPDLDNLVHKLTDQWIGIFYADDSQIVRLLATKSYACDQDGQPGVEIIVKAWPSYPL